ncbi:MAG: (d)CMP kinase [Rhodospirillales bacterium]|nr:(d)CMP kinase [Acetobacter sp.]
MIEPSAGPGRPVIAIDGPAGAGKSTVAAHLARKFGLLNLETGAMYRAFALTALESGVQLDAEPALLTLSAGTQITLEPQPSGNRVLLNGVDVSQRIRQPDVTAAASLVSVYPAIRHWMVEQQRELGAHGNVVMEGRDIGTVVFPDAQVKIFLDALPETRGDRRFRQTESSGTPERRELVEQELRERDRRDTSRAESPLRPAPDAVILDTTHLTLQEVLSSVEQLVKRALSSA